MGGLIPGNCAESGLTKNKEIRIPQYTRKNFTAYKSKSNNCTAIVTLIIPTELDKMLKGYNSEKVKLLINGFTFGFRIPYNGNDTQRVSKYLRSATENVELLG